VAVRLIRLLPSLLILLLLGLFGFVYWQAQGFMPGARLFPQYVALAGIALALAALASEALARAGAGDDATQRMDLGVEAEEQTPSGYGRALGLFLWIGLYLALLLLLGGPVGSAAFVLAFLRLRFAAPWRVCVGLAGGILLLVHGLGLALQLRWPPALLLPGF
jgi:hypothetical protein